MAYIPMTYAPMEPDNNREYRYMLPSGGVKLSDKDEYFGDGKAADIFNMDVTESGIETRGGVLQKTAYFDVGGTFHSITKKAFCKRIVVHTGTHLLSYADGEQDLSIINDSLPDKASIMCEFMSKLYIYCDRRIFSLDSNFVLMEELPFAPLIFDGVSSVLGTSDSIYTTYNLCAPRVRARYGSFVSSSINLYNFTLPANADLSRPSYVYVNGKELSESNYKVKSADLEIKADLEPEKDVVEIVYYLSDPSAIGFEDILENCTLAESYGGNVNSGTRIFFTGNPQKKGYYFKSTLQNPLYLPSDEFEIIGDGCEDITAMKKMYGDLIIFTKSTVYRMAYQLNSGEPYFTVKEIGNGVGCDCPASVCLIDNRVVFLNSEKGVFIVDSTEKTGEQNIKPISGNILSGKGRGLLQNQADALKKCCAVDYGRKYIMCIGNLLYIWDYDKSAFYDSGNYSVSQSRLIWYTYDDVSADMLFELGGKLTTFSKDGYLFCAFDESAKSGIVSGFSSGRLNIESAFEKKHITGMNMLVYAYGIGKMTFTFYADGKEYLKKQISVSENKKTLIKLKLPAKTLYSFSFDVLSDSGVRIEEMTFKYKVI